jgi:hypothetical protein
MDETRSMDDLGKKRHEFRPSKQFLKWLDEEPSKPSSPDRQGFKDKRMASSRLRQKPSNLSIQKLRRQESDNLESFNLGARTHSVGPEISRTGVSFLD